VGYREVRRKLSEQYGIGFHDSDIQVMSADLSGDRRLVLHHNVHDGVLLDKHECDRTLLHVAHLWGYRVRLLEMDIETGETLREHETLPMP
ncbi:MAG: SpoVR family protein, partial [Pseudomonadota bacterium]